MGASAFRCMLRFPASRSLRLSLTYTSAWGFSGVVRVVFGAAHTPLIRFLHFCADQLPGLVVAGRHCPKNVKTENKKTRKLGETQVLTNLLHYHYSR